MIFNFVHVGKRYIFPIFQARKRLDGGHIFRGICLKSKDEMERRAGCGRGRIGISCILIKPNSFVFVR